MKRYNIVHKVLEKSSVKLETIEENAPFNTNIMEKQGIFCLIRG